LKPLISFGSSPRGSINLAVAANVTLYQTCGYVIPEDVRAVVHDVRHRIGVTTRQKQKTSLSRYYKQIVNEVEVP
jgi:MoxR-like ATPase